MSPIAVIGMACRLPGGIDSPDLLWEALLRGDDLITEIPADRWDADEYYDPEPGVRGRSVSRWGGFLDDIAGFDSEFFGIAEREATAIDPQHRLLLETSWEAVEHAGLAPKSLAGSLTGVFVGLAHDDYAFVTGDAGALGDAYAFTGTPFNMASGRIAYAMGLRGPAVTVDTCLLVRPACRAHGLPQSAGRREQPCPGGWLLGDAGTAHVRVRFRAGHALAYRTLPDVRRRRRRVRAFRGLRRGDAQAVAARAGRW